MMIKLTRSDGETIYLNAAHIKGALPIDPIGARGKCRIITSGDSLEYSVLETLLEVATLCNDAAPFEQLIDRWLPNLMDDDLVAIVGELIDEMKAMHAKKARG